ncbi:MAG: shikimate dehydrogenase [Oceanospirillaceae bacterium]|nr:shikimate dehydrogenase [Oceanospirillaceae bacterium]MCP5334687.1 shikimate dehydrogenase [Oceanospirillaceae bacterium]MCP5351320.1 shikimate dehydrogenase [Oceanospirillaceae bacterium]
MSDLYAVMGNPINHSKSPQIHSAFAEQTQQDLIYSATLVPLDGFEHAVQEFFRNAHGKGLNVTVPFKEEAYQLAQIHSPRALRAGAVNTLKRHEDGRIYGDNTDGLGLVADLTRNLQISLSGKRILLLGAGGAVKGVLEPLLAEKPAQIVIANRSIEKAIDLAKAFSDIGNVTGCGFAQVQGYFDVIINGTSASLQGDLPPLPSECVASHTQVYDMMYGAEPTLFMQWAKQQGAKAAYDGLGMLVEQAAEAFLLWRGVRPQTAPVMAGIRAKLLKPAAV